MAEAAICRRCLRAAAWLFLAAFGLAALSELQHLLAREPAGARDWREALSRLGRATPLLLPVALAFAAGHVFWRLRRDGVMVTLMAGGWTPQRLRRSVLWLAAVGLGSALAAGLLAEVWAVRDPRPLVAEGDGWRWAPRPPAAGWRWQQASLAVTPAAAVMPAYDAHAVDVVRSLGTAVAGASLIVIASYLALLIGSRWPTAVHSAVLSVTMLAAAAALAVPGAGVVAAVAGAVVAERTFAARGIRRWR